MDIESLVQGFFNTQRTVASLADCKLVHAESTNTAETLVTTQENSNTTSAPLSKSPEHFRIFSGLYIP